MGKSGHVCEIVFRGRVNRRAVGGKYELGSRIMPQGPVLNSWIDGTGDDSVSWETLKWGVWQGFGSRETMCSV
jgi:hypothetical protein